MISESSSWHAISRYPDGTPAEAKHVQPLQHGCSILWQNLDRIGIDLSAGRESEFFELFEVAKQHLRLVFHRFMGNNSLNKSTLVITVNGETLHPVDRIHSSNSNTTLQPSITLAGKHVKLTGYIIPHPKYFTSAPDSDEQGFYVYRNNRLICWAKWLRLASKSQENKLARISVDLDSTCDDDWRINFQKTTVEVPASLKEPMREYARSVIINAQRALKVRRSTDVVRRNSESTAIEYLWHCIASAIDGSKSLRVNRDHTILKKIHDGLTTTSLQDLLGEYVKMIETMIPYDLIYKQANAPQQNDSYNDTRTAIVDLAKAINGSFPDLNWKQIKEMLLKMEQFSTKSDIIAEISEGEIL